jgi:leucyl/phenylalanyl-tRNA--protein transferase
MGPHFRQIVSSTEGFSQRGEHHHSAVVPLGYRIKRLLQLVQHLYRQWIELFGAIEDQPHDTGITFIDHNQFIAHVWLLLLMDELSIMPQKPSLPWLDQDDPFPPVHQALDEESPMPGLLAAGADLSVQRLVLAYSQGIFPWFSQQQPILWWSPNPRMVLQIEHFKLHRSLRQTIRRWQASGEYRLSIDQAFDQVISACASTPREGQQGTWIIQSMQTAYKKLHQAGHAHSIEVWKREQLIGGLYLVNLGHGVFGESMFSHATDASKVALCALVTLCRAQGAKWIDCQQNTAHLGSLGALPVSRSLFEEWVRKACDKPDLNWNERWIYWDHMLSNDFGK